MDEGGDGGDVLLQVGCENWFLYIE